MIMGQIADDMINGRMCSECGICFKKEHGYPVLCDSCWKEAVEEGRVKEKLNELAGLHSIDIVFIKEVDKGFRDIILQTGKVVYEANSTKAERILSNKNKQLYPNEK